MYLTGTKFNYFLKSNDHLDSQFLFFENYVEIQYVDLVYLMNFYFYAIPIAIGTQRTLYHAAKKLRSQWRFTQRRRNIFNTIMNSRKNTAIKIN